MNFSCKSSPSGKHETNSVLHESKAHAMGAELKKSEDITTVTVTTNKNQNLFSTSVKEYVSSSTQNKESVEVISPYYEKQHKLNCIYCGIDLIQYQSLVHSFVQDGSGYSMQTLELASRIASGQKL